MGARQKLFAIAALLLVLGAGLLFLDPLAPEAECAKDPNVTSGAVDSEKGCAISIESYERIRESETGPQWDNIGGLVLVLAGLGVGVAGLRKKDPARSPS